MAKIASVAYYFDVFVGVSDRLQLTEEYYRWSIVDEDVLVL